MATTLQGYVVAYLHIAGWGGTIKAPGQYQTKLKARSSNHPFNKHPRASLPIV